MAKLGLLGALAGAGKGISDLGDDILRRRERALEEARLLAKEERDRAFRSEENRLTREATAEERRLTREAADARTDKTIAARKEILKEQQGFTVSRDQAKAAAAKDLARFKNDLTRASTKEAIRLRQSLKDNDIVGLHPSAPDPKHGGKVQILGERGDGVTVEMKQWVDPTYFTALTPARPRAESADAFDEFGLGEEEEEDQ